MRLISHIGLFLFVVAHLDLRNLETKDKDRHYLLSSASCPVHVLKSLKTKNAERHYIHPPTPKLFSHKSDSRIANVCLSVCEPNPSASQIQAHLPLCLYLNLLIWYLSDLESLKSVFIDTVQYVAITLRQQFLPFFYVKS